MRVAAGQFAVTPVWRTNAHTCVAMMQQAAREGAALLVLPEALLARDDNDPDLSVKSAQPLDGAFLQLLLAESARNGLTTVLTLHVPSGREERPTRWWYCVKGKSLPIITNFIYTTPSQCRSPGGWIPAGRFRR
jgi:predicted amidohydrolase